MSYCNMKYATVSNVMGKKRMKARLSFQFVVFQVLLKELLNDIIIKL